MSNTVCDSTLAPPCDSTLAPPCDSTLAPLDDSMLTTATGGSWKDVVHKGAQLGHKVIDAGENTVIKTGSVLEKGAHETIDYARGR